ncbi:MAG TPA: hypothetical protein VN808_05090, partial [Stellaceae bacterium]|nr:hypothetical protein [Stellaceae bacterium]
MPRRLSLDAALVVVSVFATLAVLEIGLRLHQGIPPLEFTNFIGDRVNGIKQYPGFLYDERLGWRVKPNLRWPSNSTDAYGVHLPSSTDRTLPIGGILASGDSFTFGSDVSNAESWPAYLETITGTPVVNAAVPGWGADQIVMRAEDMIGIARPQTLIVGFQLYSIGLAEEEIHFGAHKPYYTIENNQLVLHNVPVPPFVGHPSELGFLRGTLGYSYAIYWAAERLGFEQWLGSTNSQHTRATPEGTGE